MSRPEKSPLGLKVFLAIFLTVLSPLIVLVVVLYFLHQLLLYALVWLLWLPKRRDVLLVYSDSPIWHEYMTTQILPLVEDRAMILNWSERKTWPKWSLSAHVLRSIGGRREFNPLVAIFRPFRRAKVVRFYSALRTGSTATQNRWSGYEGSCSSFCSISVVKWRQDR